MLKTTRVLRRNISIVSTTKTQNLQKHTHTYFGVGNRADIFVAITDRRTDKKTINYSSGFRDRTPPDFPDRQEKNEKKKTEKMSGKSGIRIAHN